jgi:hypothetical protein
MGVAKSLLDALTTNKGAVAEATAREIIRPGSDLATLLAKAPKQGRAAPAGSPSRRGHVAAVRTARTAVPA